MSQPAHPEHNASRSPKSARDPLEVPHIADAPLPGPPPAIPELLARPPAAKPPSRADDSRERAEGMKAWGIGLNFAFGVMGMALIGWAIQTWWLKSAAPWPLVIGLGIGIIGGFVRFIRDAIAANRD